MESIVSQHKDRTFSRIMKFLAEIPYPEKTNYLIFLEISVTGIVVVTQ